MINLKIIKKFEIFLKKVKQFELKTKIIFVIKFEDVIGNFYLILFQK